MAEVFKVKEGAGVTLALVVIFISLGLFLLQFISSEKEDIHNLIITTNPDGTITILNPDGTLMGTFDEITVNEIGDNKPTYLDSKEYDAIIKELKHLKQREAYLLEKIDVVYFSVGVLGSNTSGMTFTKNRK